MARQKRTPTATTPLQEPWQDKIPRNDLVNQGFDAKMMYGSTDLTSSDAQLVNRLSLLLSTLSFIFSLIPNFMPISSSRWMAETLLKVGNRDLFSARKCRVSGLDSSLDVLESLRCCSEKILMLVWRHSEDLSRNSRSMKDAFCYILRLKKSKAVYRRMSLSMQSWDRRGSSLKTQKCFWMLEGVKILVISLFLKSTAWTRGLQPYRDFRRLLTLKGLSKMLMKYSMWVCRCQIKEVILSFQMGIRGTLTRGGGGTHSSAGIMALRKSVLLFHWELCLLIFFSFLLNSASQGYKGKMRNLS